MDYINRLVKWWDLNQTLSSVAQACSSLNIIFFTFQTPDARMAVIRCFKTVTQSFIKYSWADLKFCSSLHIPLLERKGTRSFDWWRAGRIKGSNIRKLWGSCLRASRDVKEGRDMVRMARGVKICVEQEGIHWFASHHDRNIVSLDWHTCQVSLSSDSIIFLRVAFGGFHAGQNQFPR